MALTGYPVGDKGWGGAIREAVWIYEGNISPAEVEDNHGNTRPGVLRAAPLHEGDIVELFDDAEIYFANPALDGATVVRAASGTGRGYVGKIIEIVRAEKMPAAQLTTLKSMIDGRYLRKATVEFLGLIGRFVAEAKIVASSPASVIPVADPSKLVLDVSEQQFQFGTGTNNQLVPMTRLTGSTGSDVTGPIMIGVGFPGVEKV